MYKLVTTLCDCYGATFPELVEQNEFIAGVIKAEEDSFKKNLDRGIRLFGELTDKLKKGGQISGKDAFVLYDTYGFPVDMTCQMAEEIELNVDMKGYEAALKEAKELSKGDRKTVTADWIVLNDCDDIDFVGYDKNTTQGKVVRYRATGEQDSKGKDVIQLMLNVTPFYGESGGQVGDTGLISNDGFAFEVTDTKKIDGQNVCFGVLTSGEINGDIVSSTIDDSRRASIRRNHTATHLLHQALKDVLGDHVQQKGSLVTADALRFDFAHFQGVTDEELAKVERIVNEQVLASTTLNIDLKGIDEAKEMGAQALFGEKYGDVVRVVQVGDYSLELCGGCHVASTGEIGLIKITSESSISAGIRRIEAVTGMAAYELATGAMSTLADAAAVLKCQSDDVLDRISATQGRVKELEKECGDLKRKMMLSNVDDLVDGAEEHLGVKILAKHVEVSDVDSLKDLAHSLRNKVDSGLIVLGADVSGKAMIVVTLTDDLVEKGAKSGSVIMPVARLVGGGGGGHPRFAQAGGKSPEKLPEAIEAAPGIAKDHLNDILGK